ncbi:hypothetical protein CHS0354_020624 [Potamilus streckersoni]|uniref:Cadherin domain-containing protein n=1 Tax=Potamilus streckersoni TaxID=2493646 RepID=A0AAE0SQ62_9BIVA|nr:hypothetical protein CHS0354_020624 [Potamilus streckersoni]
MSALIQPDMAKKTTVGTVVYNLLERTSDKDRPASGSFFYDLVNNRQDKFRIVSASSGEIRLAPPLDYESGQRGYFLNISVKVYSPARTSFASLWINVNDVNDQGPQYDYPDCVAPCLIPEYTAITNLAYTGPLKVQPASIRAHDLDTLNFSIGYSFFDDLSGASSNNDDSGFFRIDKNNGTVYQLKPASEDHWPTKRLVVIVRINNSDYLTLGTVYVEINLDAAEAGSSQSAAHAILMVRVRKRDHTLNATEVEPRDSSTMIKRGNSLLSAVIAVNVLTGIILITSATVIFLIQRRYRKMVSSEHTKSERSTKEEEIHSERPE